VLIDKHHCWHITIGDDVVVGVGSVVSREIPSGVVAAGIPAREIVSTEEWISKKKNELEIYPRFDERYSTRLGVTDEMKRDMNEKMKDRYGYII